MSHILSLNIESTDIRYLSSDGKKVKHWGSIPLEKGIVREGVVLNSQALGSAIGEIKSLTGFKKGKVVTSLSGMQSVHRIVALPKTPRKFVEDAIINEAKKVMPVSMDQLYLSWHALGAREDGMQQYFVLGIPRNTIDSQATALRQAAIAPSGMNLKPVALARMVNLADALIVDIEPGSYTIVMVSKGIPVIIRSLAADPEDSALSRAEHTFVELEHTLQFYESSLSSQPIAAATPLFLTGKIVAESELYQRIASDAGYTLKNLESPPGCPSYMPLAQFAANIGLVSSQVSPCSRKAKKEKLFKINKLNSLPYIYLPKRFTGEQRLTVAIAMSALLLLIPLYQAIDSASGDVNRLRAEDEALKPQIVAHLAKVGETNRKAAELNQAIADMQTGYQSVPKITSLASEIQAKRQRTYDAIALVFDYLPKHIGAEASLSKVLLNGDALTLEGKIALNTADYPDAANQAYNFAIAYANSLKTETGYFSNVNVTSIAGESKPADEVDAQPTETVKFKISLQINDIILSE